MVADRFAIRYRDKIQQLPTLDHIEEVVKDTPLKDRVHYLPHSAVLKDDSSTTEFKIVMDGSSKASTFDLSLNECLSTGPNLMGNMLKCLLNFRSHEFAASADLGKAFLHPNLRVQDRDCMRFYLEDIFDPNSQIKAYRYRKAILGASYSPYLLGAVLVKYIGIHVQDKVFIESLKNIFLDNSMNSKETEELLEFFSQAREIFKLGGMNIPKWGKNSPKEQTAAKQQGV